jgi:hypothetical protein
MATPSAQRRLLPDRRPGHQPAAPSSDTVSQLGPADFIQPEPTLSAQIASLCAERSAEGSYPRLDQAGLCAVITSLSRCRSLGRSRYGPVGRSARPYFYASALWSRTYLFAAMRDVRNTSASVASAPRAWFLPTARTLIAERGQPSGGSRARSRLIGAAAVVDDGHHLGTQIREICG